MTCFKILFLLTDFLDAEICYNIISSYFWMRISWNLFNSLKYHQHQWNPYKKCFLTRGFIAAKHLHSGKKSTLSSLPDLILVMPYANNSHYFVRILITSTNLSLKLLPALKRFYLESFVSIHQIQVFLQAFLLLL